MLGSWLLNMLAQRFGCDTGFVDRQPVRSPLGSMLCRLNCTQRMLHRASGGSLIQVINLRFINLRSTREKLVPELSDRLIASGLTNEAAGMRLTGDARRLICILFPAQDPQMCNVNL